MLTSTIPDCYAKDSMKKQSYQRGQVLLLVVLLITVVLTVAMSLLTRSITNIRLTNEEDQSKKALAAAEAGIEKSLIANSAITNGALSNNSTFTTTYTDLSSDSYLMNNNQIVYKDQGADIWLSQYSENDNQLYQNPWSGTLYIYWGASSNTCNVSESVNTMAALEVLIFTGNRNNPVGRRYAFDPCSARRSQNGFSTVSSGATIDGRSFAYGAVISLSSPGLIARVIPLYANTYIGVRGNPILPSQGTVITSTGVSGETTRTVSVLKEHPSLPAEFMSYTFLWPK